MRDAGVVNEGQREDLLPVLVVVEIVERGAHAFPAGADADGAFFQSVGRPLGRGRFGNV